MKKPKYPHFRPVFVLLLAASSACVSVSNAQTSWTQTGSSTATSITAPDSNMSWSVGTNWSTGLIPDVNDAIQFNNVTADTSALTGVTGRGVVLLNADYLGTASSSLTLTQTTAGFTNNVYIRYDSSSSSSANYTFQVGQTSISANSVLSFSGVANASTPNPGNTHQFTLGYGSTSVVNSGTLSVSFQGNSSNRIVNGYVSIASGSTFTNNGTTIFNFNTPNSNVQGNTRVNALVGQTTNTGTLTITRNGDNTGATAYDTARGGIEFESLNNSTTGSSFSYTSNNSIVLATGSSTQPIADRVAMLTITNALENSGTMTISRTPLTSGAGTSGNNTDNVSRVLSVQAGSFNNGSSGAFTINHNNAAIALSTTSSTVEMTVTGAAQNAGWLALKGSGTSASDGAIFTHLVTKGGFTNANGGILTVTGSAVLTNTGAFSNANTAASRTIQGSTRTWDTTGLTIESSTTTAQNFNWATGIDINPLSLTSGTTGSFAASNFTIGSMSLTTGSGAAIYTLTGGGDVLIENGFSLTGTLSLGDWTAVSTVGGTGQTLFFDDISLQTYVNGLIASGNITATLASGYSLTTYSNATNDAFYIGVTVPEPGSFALVLAGLVIAYHVHRARRRVTA